MKKFKNSDIFKKNSLSRQIRLPFESVGENLRDNLLKKLQEDLEGKCTKEGFIKKESIHILLYSSGNIKSNYIVFNVVFECYICRPVEGMLIKCKVINNTKAGVRAEYIKSDSSPIIVFIARDHNYKNKLFSTIEVADIIQIKVIGIRYELNDTNISVLGEFTKKY
jgi:DNA-directed RNA polymerase subunit E'/Rpb7